MVIERGETLLKRNVGYVKRFTEQRPEASQPQQLGIQPVEQPLVQQPVLEPATLPVPEPDEIPTQGLVTEAAMEPSPQPAVTLVPEQTSEPLRSTRKRTEPSWLKDYVT